MSPQPPTGAASSLGRNLTLIRERQRQFAATLDALLLEGDPVALVDFPAHGNPGDAAIWLGETRFLASRGHPIVWLSDYRHATARILRRRIGRGTILLHGGGNFGDIYGHYQRFREGLVAAMPETRFVQMPQTLHFRDAGEKRRSARIFRRHRRFTLLVRDEPSLAIARRDFTEDARLCPDSAFNLGPLRPAQQAPRQELLWMRRVDPEVAQETGDPATVGIEVADWYSGLFLRKGWRAEYAIRRSVVPLLGCVPQRGMPIARLFDPLALRVYASGRAMLGRAKVLITDRLHAHILCVLLDKPHVVLDNSYGKTSAFRAAWTANAELAAWADSPSEAREKAFALLARE